jgi:hypothetical protein
LLSDGRSKPIEEIRVGDKVIATDPATGKAEPRRVARTYVHEDVPTYDIVVDGETVTTTAKHPFWVEGRGWTAVSDLQPGDQFVQPDGTIVPVQTVDATGEPSTDAALTHMDIAESSLDDILAIVARIQGAG